MRKFFFASYAIASLFFLPFVSGAEEYPFRKIEQPILPLEIVDQLIVAAPQRTGSTLLYLVCQYLFEEKLAPRGSFDKRVVKTHDAKACQNYLEKHPDTYVVVSIRNPMDSFLSKIKALFSLKMLPKSERFIEGLLQSHIKEQMAFLDLIDQIPSDKLLVVQYETFNENLLDLLARIEQKFQIEIPLIEKQKIACIFSKKAITEFSKKYPHFAKQDPITGIHGGHIQQDQREWIDYISEDSWSLIKESLLPLMKKCGYEEN